MFLACEHDTEIDRVAAELPSVTLADGTVLDEATIRADLEHTRARGFAISVDERQFDTTAVAALITDSTGQTLGAVGISGASTELRDMASSTLPADVRRAAQAIGSRVPAIG